MYKALGVALGIRAVSSEEQANLPYFWQSLEGVGCI